MLFGYLQPPHTVLFTEPNTRFTYRRAYMLVYLYDAFSSPFDIAFLYLPIDSELDILHGYFAFII